MASRRVLASTALRVLSAQRTAAIRPVRPAFVAATRRQWPAVAVAQRLGGRRWYSSDDLVPGARVWKFEELKAKVDADLAKQAEEDSAKEVDQGSAKPVSEDAAEQANEDLAKQVILIDVREPIELFTTGKIPGAINIPITSAVQSFHVSDKDFKGMYGFARPPKDAELLFYCKAGPRAHAAAGLARHAGWEHVSEYLGSWKDWEQNKGPVEKVENPDDENPYHQK